MLRDQLYLPGDPSHDLKGFFAPHPPPPPPPATACPRGLGLCVQDKELPSTCHIHPPAEGGQFLQRQLCTDQQGRPLAAAQVSGCAALWRDGLLLLEVQG